MENQQQRHQFEWVWRHRWRCRVCQWTWSTRRQSACPGVPRYAHELRNEVVAGSKAA